MYADIFSYRQLKPSTTGLEPFKPFFLLLLLPLFLPLLLSYFYSSSYYTNPTSSAITSRHPIPPSLPSFVTSSLTPLCGFYRTERT